MSTERESPVRQPATRREPLSTTAVCHRLMRQTLGGGDAIRLERLCCARRRIVQDRRHRYRLASAEWDEGTAPAVAEVLLVDGIHWGSLGPLLLISLAIMGSPGPATISLIAAGSAYGVWRSIPYLLGIMVGTTIVLLAVATGITSALLAIPAIGSILIWSSVVYILWLAYHIATAPPLSEPTAASSTFSVAGGTFLGIANPKAWVAIAAVFASGHLADDTKTDAAAKIAVLTAMIIAICAMWLVAGTSIAPFLRDPVRARVVNAALAAALVGATALAVLH